LPARQSGTASITMWFLPLKEHGNIAALSLFVKGVATHCKL